MACAPSNHSRAAPPSQAVPRPYQQIRVSAANAPVAMCSYSWGVGGPNTQWPEHAGQTPEPGARGAVAFELDTTVRERILALDVTQKKLEIEGDIYWRTFFQDREDEDEERVSFNSDAFAYCRYIENGDDLMQECLTDAIASAPRRRIYFDHQGSIAITVLDNTWLILLRQPMLLYSKISFVAAFVVGLGDIWRHFRSQYRPDAFALMMELAAVSVPLLMMILVITMPEKACRDADMKNGVTTDYTTQRRTTAPTDGTCPPLCSSASCQLNDAPPETRVEPRATRSMVKQAKRLERERHAAAARARAPTRSSESESRNEATHPSTPVTVARNGDYDELGFDPGLTDFIAYLDLSDDDDDRHPKRSQRSREPMVVSLAPDGDAPLGVPNPCAVWARGAREKRTILCHSAVPECHTWTIPRQFDDAGHDGGLGSQSQSPPAHKPAEGEAEAVRRA